MTFLSRDRAEWLARHVLPHEGALRAWLANRPVARLDADDVIQEAYAQIAALASTGHIRAPRAYLFQVARSILLRHLRRAKVVRFDELDDLQFEAEIHDAPSPEQQAISREEFRLVARAIEGLPPKCREAFVLWKLHDLSQREVASRMGVSLGTVEKHLAKGLRAVMAAYGRHPELADRAEFETCDIDQDRHAQVVGARD